jgi:hypothetical protein
LLGTATVTLAHHSFAAEFDAERPLELEGVVKEMRFSNPHSWIYLTVTLKSGEKQDWAVEGAAPNALLRRGFSKSSLRRRHGGPCPRLSGTRPNQPFGRLQHRPHEDGGEAVRGLAGHGGAGEIENPEAAPSPAK